MEIFISFGSNAYSYKDTRLERLSGYKRCLNPWNHSPNTVQCSDSHLDLGNHVPDFANTLCPLDHIQKEKSCNVIFAPKKTAACYNVAQVILFISNILCYSAIQTSHPLVQHTINKYHSKYFPYHLKSSTFCFYDT